MMTRMIMTVKIKFNIMNEFLDDFARILAEKVQNSLIEGGYVAHSKMNEPSAKLYSIAEVCERLSVSKPTFFRHRKKGLITPSAYVGNSPRFTDEDINNYLTQFKAA